MASNLSFSIAAFDNASKTFLKVSQSVEKLADRLDALDRKRTTVEVDVKVDRRGLDALDRGLAGAVVNAAAFGRALGTLALPVAVAGAAPVIAGIGAAAVAASGALLLLPAAGAAGALAFGALKIGASGFGEALSNMRDPEAFAESIAKLAPAARDAAVAVQGLLPRFDELKATLEERLFDSIGEEISALGHTYLPIAEGVFGRIAGSANEAMRRVSSLLQESTRVADLQGIGDAGADSFRNLSGALAPLVAIFVDIAAVGGPIMERLTSGAGAAAGKFADFIAEARQSGQLAGWIEGGLDALRQLGELAGNVGSIFYSVFGTMASTGAGALNVLVQLTGEVARFLRSGEGQNALTTLFDGIAATVAALLPGLRALGGALVAAFVDIAPALPAVGAAFSAIGEAVAPLVERLGDLIGRVLPPLARWVQENAALVVGFGVAIAGLSVAVSVSNAVLAARTAALAVAAAATAVWSGATAIATGAQWLLNAALLGNPFVLVGIALAALVAGVVVAYRESETFRAIVTAAWEGIRTAAVWAWENALKPVFDGLVGILRDVVGPTVMWLWREVIEPAFAGISFAIDLYWNYYAKPIFNAFVWTLQNVVGPAVMWLWNEVIAPAFANIGSVISRSWTDVIQPTFGFLRGGIEAVGGVFDRIATFIGDSWGRIRQFVRSPIAFAIDVVINGGIIPAWNWLVDKIGIGSKVGLAPSIPGSGMSEPNPKFADGGGVFGRGTGRSDSIDARLSHGEHVVTADEVSGAGGHANVSRWRAMMREGRLPALFALGGPVDRAMAAVRPAGSQISSGYRRGDSGYHGSARALDLVGNLGAINRSIAQTWPNSTQLIFTPGVNLLGGRPHRYNAATRADHWDHVHWAMENVAMLDGKTAGGGGGFDMPSLWDLFGGPFQALMNAALGKLAGMPQAGQFGRDFGEGLPRKAAALIVEKGKALAESVFGGGGTPGTGPVVDQVRAVARRFGWGDGPQWAAWDRLIQKESSWNPRAQNPVSTAYGLGQFLNSTWATVGGTKTSNPGLQAEYMGRYIKQRYGNPGAALAFHGRNNYYANGGLVDRPTLGVLGEAGPELAIPLGRPDRAKQLVGQAGIGEKHYHLTVYNADNDAVNLQEQFRRMEMLSGI